MWGYWANCVITADMSGLNKAEKIMRKRFGNPSPAFPAMRAGISLAMRKVFRSGGKGTVGKRGRSGKWAPNKNTPWVDRHGNARPGYADWKRGISAGVSSGGLSGGALTFGGGGVYSGKKGNYWPEPLSLSGKLERSLTRPAWTGQVFNPVGKTEFEFGTSVRSRGRSGGDYPRGQMEGMQGTGKRGGLRRMAQRPFLNWDLKGASGRMWSEAIVVWLMRYLFPPGIWSNPALPEVDHVSLQEAARSAHKTGGLLPGGGNRLRIWEAK